jgi:tRNA1Val (adenine37-N6)-methyltransferase
MSERNPEIPFTYKYSQPTDYHFSIDSIEASWEIANYLKTQIAEDRSIRKSQITDYLSSQIQHWRVLDLCAGCGVMGFELNFHLPSLKKIDFIEVQTNYETHFKSNRQQVQNEGEFNFIPMNYADGLTAEFANKYDLLICNPPYFMPGQGALSPNEFKNRCRFYIDSTFQKLIEFIIHTLKFESEAFLLLRDLEDHDIDLLTELRKVSKGKLEVENLMMIRGTFLLKLKKIKEK